MKEANPVPEIKFDFRRDDKKTIVNHGKASAEYMEARRINAEIQERPEEDPLHTAEDYDD